MKKLEHQVLRITGLIMAKKEVKFLLNFDAKHCLI